MAQDVFSVLPNPSLHSIVELTVSVASIEGE